MFWDHPIVSVGLARYFYSFLFIWLIQHIFERVLSQQGQLQPHGHHGFDIVANTVTVIMAVVT